MNGTQLRQLTRIDQTKAVLIRIVLVIRGNQIIELNSICSPAPRATSVFCREITSEITPSCMVRLEKKINVKIEKEFMTL